MITWQSEEEALVGLQLVFLLHKDKTLIWQWVNSPMGHLMHLINFSQPQQSQMDAIKETCGLVPLRSLGQML